MVLERIHPFGAEEWYCFACGRCLLMTWKPRFMEIVRKAGDKNVFHVMSKSLQMRLVKVLPIDDTAPQEETDMLIEHVKTGFLGGVDGGSWLRETVR
jgi:hypothetical protein